MDQLYVTDSLLEHKSLRSQNYTKSDTSVGCAAAHLKSAVCQEPLIDVAVVDSSVATESENLSSDPSSLIQLQSANQISGYTLSNQLDHKQQQQDVQYFQAGAQCILQYPAGPMPVPSYYPIYHPSVQQEQHNPYQPNQLYPLYLVPMRPMHSYDMSMQSNIMGASASYTMSRPPLYPNTAFPVAYKEVSVPPLIPESATNVYSGASLSNQHFGIPSNPIQQQFVDSPDNRQHAPPDSVITPKVSAMDYNVEFHDDLAYSQIYKTQPPAPTLPAQYHTMTKTTVLLSDNTAKQVSTAQPQ